MEVAILNIKEGYQSEFEKNFRIAAPIIKSMHGYLDHDLKKCLEKENQYILLVHWERLQDHEEGFRKSLEYEQWKKLLHHCYEPFPEVLHYQ